MAGGKAIARALARAEGKSARLALRTPEEKARFLAEGVQRIPGKGPDGVQYRFPIQLRDGTPDVMSVGFTSGADEGKQFVDFVADSSIAKRKAWDDEKTKLMLEAMDRTSGKKGYLDVLFPKQSEARFLAKQAAKRNALGERPSEFAPVDVSPAEQAAIIRRISAIVEGHAKGAQPTKLNWSAETPSRGKLYGALAKRGADANGYKATDFHGLDRVAPVGDPAPLPGIPSKDPNFAKQLPLLGATAAVGAGALAMQPGEAEAAPFGAAARVLDDGRMIGPKVTGYHGSTSPWLLRGDAPRFDTSAGLHVGNKAQAKTFGGESFPKTLANYIGDNIDYHILNPPSVKYPDEAPGWTGFRGKVTLKEGREIGTPDLINWLPQRWAESLDKIEGLTPAEKAQFGSYLGGVSGPDRHTTETVRRYLADQLGVKRVKYHNAGEGNPDAPDNWSYIALSPDVAVTHSIPRQVAPYAAAGAAGAVLYPQDAEAAPSPSVARAALLGALPDRVPGGYGAVRAGQAGGLSSVAIPATAAVGAGALAMQPGDAEAAPMANNKAIARAIARQAPRFNEALDTSLDVASIFDLSGGYATETARALKDLPQQIQGSALNKGAGTLALAPLTGATEALSSIGQLPDMAVDGYRAVSRALARAKADADARAREQDVYGKPGILYRRGK